MPDHDASRAQEKTLISLRSKVMGVVALLASGFCVLEGFAVANATYIDPGMYPGARAMGLGWEGRGSALILGLNAVELCGTAGKENICGTLYLTPLVLTRLACIV